MKCVDCIYWSEMIAEARGLAIYAVCLSEKSESSGKFVPGTWRCDAYTPKGHRGMAIDDPRRDRVEYPR